MNDRDLYLRTPLHIAAQFEGVALAKLLLENGASPSSASDQGITPFACTPLHIAAQFEGVALAKLLLENGASPSSASDQGVTPLAIAANFNRYNMAKILLKSGAIVSENCLSCRRFVVRFRANLHIWVKKS